MTNDEFEKRKLVFCKLHNLASFKIEVYWKSPSARLKTGGFTRRLRADSSATFIPTFDVYKTLELFDPEYYEDAVKKYGVIWDKELTERAQQEWWQKGYKAGLQEVRDVYLKKGENSGRVGECVHSIRSCRVCRFPNESLSETCDYVLDTLANVPKLRSIQNYCFNAPSI